MASTRQEKLQMRQRGAATRKTKEVDFGFSLGLGPLAPGSLGPSQHASHPTGIVAEPPPPSNSAPANTQSPLPYDSELSVLSGQKPAQRTPGSARNRGQKRSIFDIPLEEPPEERRSTKRRKIDSPSKGFETSGGQDDAITQPELVASDHDQRRMYGKRLEIDGGNKNGKLDLGTLQADNLVSSEEANGRRRSESKGDGRPSPENAQRRPTTNGKRKRSVSNEHPSPGREVPPENAAMPGVELPNLSQPVVPQESPIHEIGEAQVSAQKRAKRPRGRPSKSARASDTNKAAEESDGTSAEGAPGHSRTPKTNGLFNVHAKGKKAEPKDASNSGDIPQSQRKQKEKKKHSNSGSRGRESPQAIQPGQEPGSDQHEHEPPTAAEPTLPGPSAARKRRGRGRPSKNGSTTRELESEQAASPPNGDDTSRPSRKTRTRGETVPVTVHRLANVASLTGVPESDNSSAGEESADELSAQQKSKLPNRGGVNPADVLSQVCRETLEKTLTTLRNAVSNETNPARRAEHVRKTKAVEAYGAELEGRLFDLSEMLDSNFVLGVQAKKTKREMMDLRSRLYHIRKERQEVAMQMDAVRRKYAEENSARMSRSTVNNTLHSLELAVDRHQNRSAPDGDSDDRSEDSVSAGLELKLRTVAQRVSSKAPGAQGGLLNQIKAFNARLEAAAEKLEC